MGKRGWLKTKQIVIMLLATVLLVFHAPVSANAEEQLNGLAVGADGAWAYFVNGVVDTGYTGLVQNAEGTWYVKNGYLDWNYTDLFCAADGWYYVMGGRVPTEYTGLVRNEEGLWYVENGVIDWTHTALVNSADGWFYVLNGRVTEEYTGLIRNDAGLWYVAGGKLDESHTDLVSSVDGWFYVMDGRVTEEYTGLVSNDKGTWYIDNGMLNWNYSGLVSSVDGWFYVQEGRVPEEYVGLVANDAGNWYVQNGTISFAYEGLVGDATGWWYVQGSQVNKDYTGLATNENGTWYVQNGGIDLTYAGTVTIDGKEYEVSGGAIVGGTNDEEPSVGDVVTTTNSDGIRFESTFNEAGYLVEQRYYDANGVLLGLNMVEEYYESGRVKRINCEDMAGNALGFVSYSYKNGKLTKRILSNTTGSKNFHLAEYMGVNTSGTIICSFHEAVSGTKVSTSYNTDGSFDYRWEYNANEVLVRTIGTVTSGNAGKLVGYVVTDMKDGNKEKVTYFDLSGMVEYVYAYEYDANGKETKCTQYNGDGTISVRKFTEYHANGQAKKVTVYRGKEEKIESVSEYDEAGELVKLIVYSYLSDDELWQITFEEYTAGKLTKQTVCDANGVAWYSYAYEYDEVGREIKLTYYEGDGSIGYYGITEYYDDGNEKQYTKYYADGATNTIIRYDENGVKYERIEYYYKWDDAVTYEVTNYDVEGNIIKRAEYYDDGSMIFYCLYERYENGEIKQEMRYNSEEDITDIWKYTESGDLEEEVCYYYDNEGVLKFYTVEKYGENGETIVKAKYDAESKLLTYEAYEREYNESGQLVEYIIKDEFGKVLSKESYEYNTSGETVKYVYYDYDEAGNIVSGKAREYFPNGETKREEVYGEKGCIIKVTEYGEDGNITKHMNYDTNGEIISGYTRERYEDGRIKQSINYGTGGSILRVYEENEDGTKNKEINFHEDGTIDYGSETEYYLDGVKKQIIAYGEGGRTDYIYKYDENGVTTEYTEYGYNFSSGEFLYCRKMEYDVLGQVIKETEYDVNGEIESVTLYKWDSVGNPLSEMRYDASGNLLFGEEYEYHSNGEVKKRTDYGISGRLSAVLQYDDAGIMTQREQWYYNGDGILQSKAVWLFDGEKEVSYMKYDAFGNILSGVEYEYYENGELKKTISYGANGKISGVSQYDETGACTESKSYDYNEDGTIEDIQVFQYADGRMLSNMIYDAKGSIISGWSWEYHTNGKKAQEKEYSSFGITEIYQYDTEGNTIAYVKYSYADSGEMTAYRIVENNPDGDGITTIRCTKDMWYDAEGNIISGFYYELYEDGTPKTKMGYYTPWSDKTYVEKYSKEGKITEYTESCYSRESELLLCHFIKQYNQEEVLIKHTQYDYDYKSGELSNCFIKQYDDAGNMMEESYYDNLDNVTSRTIYERNDLRQLVKEFYYGANEVLKSFKTYEYHANGVVKEEIAYGEGGRTEYIYKYDETGLKIEYTRYTYDWSSGEFLDCYKEEYNAYGQMIKETEYDETGEVLSTKEIEYDVSGALLTEIWLDADGNVTSECNYEYYSNGTQKKVTYYEDNKLQWIYEYTEQGILVKYTRYLYYGSEEPQYYSVENYDAETGKIVERLVYRADGSLYSHETY